VSQGGYHLVSSGRVRHLLDSKKLVVRLDTPTRTLTHVDTNTHTVMQQQGTQDYYSRQSLNETREQGHNYTSPKSSQASTTSQSRSPSPTGAISNITHHTCERQTASITTVVRTSGADADFWVPELEAHFTLFAVENDLCDRDVGPYTVTL